MKINEFNSTANINMNLHKKEAESDINKLSSGNSVEDPAIMMLASVMMSDIVVDSQGLMNANDAVSMMQIADGTLSNVSKMGTKLQELSVASNNASLSKSEKDALQTEFDSTLKSIDSAVNSSSFNGKELFGSNMTFSLGNSEMSVQLESINTGKVDINSSKSIEDFTDSINKAMSQVGSAANSLESSTNSIMNAIVQKSAARSQMTDSDYANVVSDFQKRNTLLDASMIAQAHQNNLSYNRVEALLGY